LLTANSDECRMVAAGSDTRDTKLGLFPDFNLCIPVLELWSSR
jgi:hypothetical protein